MITKRWWTAGFLVLLISSAGAKERDPGKGDSRDVTLTAAAEALLEGKGIEAGRLLESLPADVTHRPAQDSKSFRSSAGRRALQYELARAAQTSSGADPFDLLTDILLQAEHDWDDGNPLDRLPWVRLFARQAALNGYRPMAAYALRNFSSTLDYLAESKSESREKRAEAAAGKPIVARDLAALENSGPEASRSASSGDAMAAGTATDLMSGRIRALLARPRLDLFPLSKLPAGIAASPADGPEGAGFGDASEEGVETENRQDDQAAAPDRTTRPAEFAPPPHFAAVRVERQGGEAAAIGLSQDYDPVGEISPGGYWVVRSHDGGATWGRRLYTGLRMEAPYVVHPGSALPLLTPDHLEVEVSIRELDESTITFPPVGLRSKREQHGLRLAIGFGDLERDQDGDGMTDLAEERLLTDPADPDTDGDGLGDAVDSLPQVPWSQAMDDESAALAAVLENIAGMKSMAIIHGVQPEGAGMDDLMARMKRATLSDERTTFVVGERRPFRSLALASRVVVLTPEEIEAARRKFGPMMPLTLSLFVLDHDRQKGYVVWTASWVGGTLALEKSGATWRVKVVSSWIT